MEKIKNIEKNIDELYLFFIVNNIENNKLILDSIIELKRLSLNYIKNKNIYEYFLKNRQRSYNFFKLIYKIIIDIKTIINKNKQKIENYENFLNIINIIINDCEYFIK